MIKVQADFISRDGNPPVTYKCGFCSRTFPTAQEAKKHEEWHRDTKAVKGLTKKDIPSTGMPKIRDDKERFNP